jgi:phage terminase large subunit GpA-like protein
MLEAGSWRATATGADPGTIGFHLSALYSPVGWLSWARIARSWEAAQGSDEAIKAFRNTVLGETWFESGEAPDWQRLYDRRETWNPAVVPAGGLFLTAGVDVQKDRFEVDVWAWGRGLESWLVEHIVIEGGPDKPAAWEALTRLLGRTWEAASGVAMRITTLAIDTGYESAAVYAWARRQSFGQVVPVKGVEGFNRASPVSGPTFVDVTGGGKRIRRGARLWTVVASTFKTETFRFLRLDRPTDEEMAVGVVHPPGTIHLPSWIESEWVKQLVGEQLVTVRNKRGFARLEWQKLRERNEALDCRVYARAAAWIAGGDRIAEHSWARLEHRFGNETVSVQKTEAIAPSQLSPPTKPASAPRPEGPGPLRTGSRKVSRARNPFLRNGVRNSKWLSRW